MGWITSGAWLALFMTCACSEPREAAHRPEPTVAVPSAAPSPAQPPARSPSLPKFAPDDGLRPLLTRMGYKPDPYASQPSCVSAPQSQLREDLLLWARIRLGSDKGGPVSLLESSYSVTATSASQRSEAGAQLGIPRFEVVHADGRVEGSDFAGEYVEPGDRKVRQTQDEAPRDLSWVPAWLGSARLARDVVEHRITLDGRVLASVKRPAEPPRLSAIACDDTQPEGVRLSWQVNRKGDGGPLLVDVMRNSPIGFIEVLPLADARQVDGVTLAPSEARQKGDVVLLVSLTDTFQLVTRGVLLPQKAL